MIPETCPKVRAKFEEWFYEYRCNQISSIQDHLCQPFYDYPPEFQQGVLLRFFREMGIDIFYPNKIEIFLIAYEQAEIQTINIKNNFNTAFDKAIARASEILEQELSCTP